MVYTVSPATMSPRALAALALLSLACKHRSPAPRPARPDAGGERLRVSESAPLGPSADRREIDVPLSWIHLLAQPIPTGSTAHAVAGAVVPCGYAAKYLTSSAEGRVVRIRLRAEWTQPGPVPAPLPRCDAPMRAWLVSEGVLRVGDWEVQDAVPHGPGDPPAPVPRVQRVVPDDGHVPAIPARWYRPCAADGDCTSGGVCARVEGVGVCLPEVDPWLSHRAPCIDGATATDVTWTSDAGVRAWRACLAACENGACARGLRCSPRGVCLPEAPGTPAAP